MQLSCDRAISAAGKPGAILNHLHLFFLRSYASWFLFASSTFNHGYAPGKLFFPHSFAHYQLGDIMRLKKKCWAKITILALKHTLALLIYPSRNIPVGISELFVL